MRDFRRALALVPGIDASMWTPRELRHSFVSLLSDAGVPLDEISQLVGHSVTTVTELVYRHQLKPVIQTRGPGHGSVVRSMTVARRCYSVCYSDPLRSVGRLANHLVRWVGLSGLEPLTSALSGRFRPPEHAKRRQRVAVNSRPDKAQRRNSGTRCQSTSGTGLRRRESPTPPRVDHDARRWRDSSPSMPHVR